MINERQQRISTQVLKSIFPGQFPHIYAIIFSLTHMMIPSNVSIYNLSHLLRQNDQKVINNIFFKKRRVWMNGKSCRQLCNGVPINRIKSHSHSSTAKRIISLFLRNLLLSIHHSAPHLYSDDKGTKECDDCIA